MKAESLDGKSLMRERLEVAGQGQPRRQKSRTCVGLTLQGTPDQSHLHEQEQWKCHMPARVQCDVTTQLLGLRIRRFSAKAQLSDNCN